jgi:putative ABC transport system ATP-binding protein
MTESLYEVKDLSFSYGTTDAPVAVLHDINLKIATGHLVLIMGPSGSGKTTLLNLLGLIEPVKEGRILFGKDDFSAMSERRKNELRRYKLGFIFQSFLLFDVLTVRENLSYFLSRQRLSGHEIETRITRTLEQVGLAGKGHSYPSELSGGQRQRVAIARALVKQPDVIIADEPTANLDQTNSRDIFSLLKSLTEGGCTVITSSHDPLAHAYATRTLALRDGRLQTEERLP